MQKKEAQEKLSFFLCGKTLSDKDKDRQNMPFRNGLLNRGTASQVCARIKGELKISG